MPTSGALTQARKRLGPEVMAELFTRVAVPCARRSTQGAWMAGRRLMSLDGFEVDAADTPANAERFGYSYAKHASTSGFCKVGVLALGECGTHAIVGADLAARGEREFTQARRLLTSGVLSSDMLVMADRGLNGYDLLRMVTEAGAAALVRVKSTIVLPALKWLPDGSYLSYVPAPRKRVRAYRQLKNGYKKLTDLPGMYVRVVDY